MDHDGMQGVAFGMMEGAVMVLGILMGSWAAITEPRLVLLIIAMTATADAFANSSALCAEEESERHSRQEILRSTIFCFFATLVAFTIPALPLLMLPLQTAILAGLMIGIALLFMLGYLVSCLAKKSWKKVIPKYVLLGICAAAACYLVGAVVA